MGLFNYMLFMLYLIICIFGWNFAYFTVMNHEPTNKLALHILLL
jgi:hypothetical protein